MDEQITYMDTDGNEVEVVGGYVVDGQTILHDADGNTYELVGEAELAKLDGTHIEGAVEAPPQPAATENDALEAPGEDSGIETGPAELTTVAEEDELDASPEVEELPESDGDGDEQETPAPEAA